MDANVPLVVLVLGLRLDDHVLRADLDVHPHGAGAASGLETIDVIEPVDGRSVGTASELRVALTQAQSSGKPALLFIDRDGLTMFLTLRAADLPSK